MVIWLIKKVGAKVALKMCLPFFFYERRPFFILGFEGRFFIELSFPPPFFLFWNHFSLKNQDLDAIFAGFWFFPLSVLLSFLWKLPLFSKKVLMAILLAPSFRPPFNFFKPSFLISVMVIRQAHHPQIRLPQRKRQDAQKKIICKKKTIRTKKYDPHNQQTRQTNPKKNDPHNRQIRRKPS